MDGSASSITSVTWIIYGTVAIFLFSVALIKMFIEKIKSKKKN